MSAGKITELLEDEETKLPRKICAFLENIDLLFLRFYNCGTFERGIRGKSQSYPVPSFLIQLCWDHQVTFSLR